MVTFLTLNAERLSPDVQMLGLRPLRQWRKATSQITRNGRHWKNMVLFCLWIVACITAYYLAINKKKSVSPEVNHVIGLQEIAFHQQESLNYLRGKYGTTASSLSNYERSHAGNGNSLSSDGGKFDESVNHVSNQFHRGGPSSADFDEKPSRMETNYNEKPTRMETNYNEKPSRMETNYEEKPSRMETNYDKKPSRMETNYDKKPSRMETNYDKKPSRMETNYDEKPSRMETNYDEQPWLETNYEEKTFWNDFDKKTEIENDKMGYLIYRCDNGRLGNCGDLSDKLKGMMTAYIIANLTGRVFKSEITVPAQCAFQDDISPNLVDWSLSTSFHTRVPLNQDVRIMNYVDDFNFHRQIRNMDFRTLPQMKSKYVYFKSNLDHMDEFRETYVHQDQLAWMRNLSRAEINAAIFKRLFKLSPKLQNNMDLFIKQTLPTPGGRLICAHLKMGGIPIFPKDGIPGHIRSYGLLLVWHFLYSQITNDADRVVFMSDSKEAVRLTKQQVFSKYLVFTQRNDTDLGNDTETILDPADEKKSRDDKQCQHQSSIIFDFFLLMRCDVLVINKSGIGRLAAYVRGSDVDLFCVMDKSVLPCQRNKIRHF